MSRPTTIDIHAHMLPEETIRLLGRESSRVAPKLIAQADGSMIMDIAGKVVQRPMPRECWDLDLRLADMDKHGVDMQAVCATVQTFFYDQEAALGLACAALQNDEIAAVVARHPDRFFGLATLPLQSPQQAADELRRAMRALGLRGGQIGTNVNGRNLDDPALEPVWAAADELRAFILVHPHGEILPGDRLKSYYMRNFVGLPFETTMAGAALVFGGVIERYPGINFCLCHGGGFLPYQAGRFVHAWSVRDEPKARLQGSPEASLSRLHYDTILHSQDALEFLVATVGPDHVLLGSDYPFDMGDFKCVARVKAIPSAGGRVLMLGARARELLGDALTSIPSRAERLRRTLAAVSAAHPFYRARFRELSIKPDDIRSLDDLDALPVTHKSDYIADPEAFRLRPDDLPADFSAEERVLWDVAYTTGTTSGKPSPFYNTAHDAYAIWDQARRCNEAEGLTAGDRIANLYPLAGFPDRRVPERHPLRHDRGLAGRAWLDRRGQFRVQGPQLAGGGARYGGALSSDRALGRAELRAPLRRRGREAAHGSLRRAARADLGRAGPGDAARGAARDARPPGRRRGRVPRALCLHRDAGRPGAMRRGRAGAELCSRPLLSRGRRSRDRPQARRRRQRRARDHPSASSRHGAAALSRRRHRHPCRARRARSAAATEKGWWPRRGAPAAWSNAAACWSTPM